MTNRPKANRSRPLFKYIALNVNKNHPKHPSHVAGASGNRSLLSKWVKDIKAAINQNRPNRPKIIFDLRSVEEIGVAKGNLLQVRLGLLRFYKKITLVVC